MTINAVNNVNFEGEKRKKHYAMPVLLGAAGGVMGTLAGKTKSVDDILNSDKFELSEDALRKATPEEKTAATKLNTALSGLKEKITAAGFTNTVNEIAEADFKGEKIEGLAKDGKISKEAYAAELKKALPEEVTKAADAVKKFTKTKSFGIGALYALGGIVAGVILNKIFYRKPKEQAPQA